MILISRFSPTNSSGCTLNGVKLWRKFMEKKKIDKRIFKKSPEELEQYMMFKRRGSRVENRKGKGSYTRKIKHKKDSYQDYT